MLISEQDNATLPYKIVFIYASVLSMATHSGADYFICGGEKTAQFRLRKKIPEQLVEDENIEEDLMSSWLNTIKYSNAMANITEN